MTTNNGRPERAVSIIIPLFNEEKAVGGVLASLVPFVAGLPYPAEIIVVDDGSTDGSGQIAASFPVTVVAHQRNKGYGAALKSGIRKAKHPYVLFFDADGQHSIAHLEPLLDKMFQCDAVIGIRKLSNSQGLGRMLGKLGLRTVASVALGIRIKDLNCGFRGMRKDVIMKYLHLLPNGFSASSTTTMVLLSRKYHVEYLCVAAANRLGKSTLRLVGDGLKALNQIFRMTMLFAPWRVFGTVGMFSTLLGAVYGAWAFWFIKVFPAGAVMLICTGVSTVFFGLLMDQIAEIRKEKLEE